MRRLLAATAAVWLAGWVGPAQAGTTLDQVRETRRLLCVAEERPGFAQSMDDGRVAGLAMDLCRAIGFAVIGPQANVAFSIAGSDQDYATIRDGGAQIAFLDAGAMFDHGLAPALLTGPAVFIETETLLVPVSGPAHAPIDLAGEAICFLSGSAAHTALERAFARLGRPIVRLAFQEEVEMADAYNVGRCQAMAGDGTQLAALRRTRGINGLTSRIIDPPLTLVPLFAATPVADGRWSATVAWLLGALLRPAGADGWSPSGDAILPRPTDLGLRATWREDTAPLGSYETMVRRNLGDLSPLRMPRWPNAAWPDGLLVAPSRN